MKNFKHPGLFCFILLLGLCHYTFALPPDWTPAPNLQHNMQIVAELQLPDGNVSINPNDMVAGFVNGECRGVGSPLAQANGVIFLSIGSNVQGGELITFQAYLSEGDQVVDLDQTLVFESLGEVGTLMDPFVFSYSQQVETFALNLLASPPEGGDLSGSGEYQAGEMVEISASANPGWQFSAWKKDGTILGDTPSHVFEMPADDVTLHAHFDKTFNVSFIIKDTDHNDIEHAIISIDGIDYPAGQYLVEDLLPGSYGFTVSKTSYSAYSGQVTIVDEDVEVFITLLPSGPPGWEETPNLQYNMQIVAMLGLGGGSFSENPMDIVAGFVNDECRGYASPMVTANGIIFLTINSNELSGEMIHFKAYLAEDDMIVDLNESFEFVNMEEVGTYHDPFIFTFGLDFTPDVLHLTNKTILSGEEVCFGALQTIHLSGGEGGHFIVEEGGSVTLIAGQNIQMHPGTHARAGSYLHASIAPDGPFCGDAKSHFLEVRHKEPDKQDDETRAEIISESSRDDFFKVYPNPAFDHFTVELHQYKADVFVQVEVFSLMGEQVFYKNFFADSDIIVSLEGLQSGIYLVRVLQGERIGVKRVVKR